MSRITKLCWVICCAPLLGWAGSAMAGDTGVVGGEASWVAAAGPRQVSRTPTHLVLMHVISATEQGALQVNCNVGADKKVRRGEFVARKGASFQYTIDALCPAGFSLEQGFEPGEFRAASGVGRTNGRRAAGPVTFTATLLVDDLPPVDHDHVFLVTVRWTNQKKAVHTFVGCTVRRE